jgi:hypothetical protein
MERDSRYPVLIRFANESTYGRYNLSEGAFKPNQDASFKDEVFGWIDDVYVAIEKGSYDAALHFWKSV